MSVIVDLIQSEADGSISFGNYLLDSKQKKEGFKNNGDVFKVKTFKEITKLEKNDSFVYESVPGTTVKNFKMDADSMSFEVMGNVDPQITLGLEDETEYCISIQNKSVGCMKTNLGGKLNLSLELNNDEPVSVEIHKSDK